MLKVSEGNISLQLQGFLQFIPVIIISNELQFFSNIKSRKLIKLAILIIENLWVVTLSPTQNFSSPKRKKKGEGRIKQYILFQILTYNNNLLN